MSVLQPLVVNCNNQYILLPEAATSSKFGIDFLTAYVAIKHFRHTSQGENFIIYANHKLLTYALASTSDRCSPEEFGHPN